MGNSLIDLARVSLTELEQNASTIRSGRFTYTGNPKVVVWFLPIVKHALMGGVRTIFMLAEELSRRFDTLNVIVCYSRTGAHHSLDGLSASLRKHFPELRFAVRLHRRNKDSVDDIPTSDIAFCTLWTTAYVLLRYNKTKKKMYFMQDYEPMFYAGGPEYLAIEQTYRFGFSCIANSPGVGERYLQYSSDVTVFRPGVDRDVYFPRDGSSVNKSEVSRIVFYGRPSNPRNSFELGVGILREVKRYMGDSVDIVSVGADWSEKEHGLEGIVRNLGLLSTLEEVAKCYRAADVGLVFMATPHPSYQPLEYMASGCVVATNINESNAWLLNEGNALLVEPLLGVAAERIVAALQDEEFLAARRQAGYRTVEKLNWSDAFDEIIHRLSV
jgi:glycosyltransferase involved in cell wall biosynthesis